MITVTIPGVPVAKARPRMTRGGHVYTPGPSRKWEAAARQYAMLAMRGQPRLEGGIVVTIEVTLPIAASWPKRQREAALAGKVHPTGRPDLDNYIKAALDACNTILWADDAQVVVISAVKHYGSTPALTLTAQEVNRCPSIVSP